MYRVEINPANIGSVISSSSSVNPSRVEVANNPDIWNLLCHLVDISLESGFSIFNICNAAVQQNFAIANYLPSIWEVLFEKARPSNIPYRRTDCVFFFKEKNDAVTFKETYPGMEFSRLCEVEIINERFSLEVDMNWLDSLDEHNATAEEAIETFKRYWAGEKTDNPTMEVLFVGSYKLNPIP